MIKTKVNIKSQSDLYDMVAAGKELYVNGRQITYDASFLVKQKTPYRVGKYPANNVHRWLKDVYIIK